MVHPGGAPRIVSPTPEESIKLGKELVEWALVDDEKDPHVAFAEWYSLEKGIIRKDWKTLVQKPEFVPYYEQAQALMSKRIKNGKMMEKSFAHRYLRIYDREVVEEENSLVSYKAQLEMKKKEEDRKQTVEDIRDALKDS